MITRECPEPQSRSDRPLKRRAFYLAREAERERFRIRGNISGHTPSGLKSARVPQSFLAKAEWMRKVVKCLRRSPRLLRRNPARYLPTSSPADISYSNDCIFALASAEISDICHQAKLLCVAYNLSKSTNNRGFLQLFEMRLRTRFSLG
jgi:hypothetical protein